MVMETVTAVSSVLTVDQDVAATVRVKDAAAHAVSQLMIAMMSQLIQEM